MVTLERLRKASWVLSAVMLAGGFYIGMAHSAQVGATLLLLSAAFALLPFATHRNN